MEPSRAPAEDFLSFVNASPSPYHAVNSVVLRLERAGFRKLLEQDDWKSICKPGGKYYVTRNISTVAAFAVGKLWEPGSPIAMIGAHTDSPCLRVKPISRHECEGFVQVAVECYGGGLWHTWFDRDLSLAGKVIVRDSDGELEPHLINLKKPILRIPTLAIHLDRQEKFEFNKETQLFPIAAMASAALNGSGAQMDSNDANTSNGTSSPSFSPLQSLEDRHPPFLIRAIAEAAKVRSDAIVDFDLRLYDTQSSCFGGAHDEFIFSARLDNLEMTYCSTVGLIESTSSTSALEKEKCIRLISLFDHEEIGSLSAQGANSNFLPTLIRRLSVLPIPKPQDVATSTTYEQTLSKSFLISADMAHSVHPNYAVKYEQRHRPKINGGPVLKVNANQRYATDAVGSAVLQEVAQRARVPLQLFVVTNISPVGSTIGPMSSAALGVKTLDLGNPQLSMHSIRETGGVFDIDYASALFTEFFRSYSKITANYA